MEVILKEELSAALHARNYAPNSVQDLVLAQVNIWFFMIDSMPASKGGGANWRDITQCFFFLLVGMETFSAREAEI